MSKLTVIEQSVSDARRIFTATLKQMAASGDEELVVLVRKRGKPVAGILSARELGRFYSWRAEQTGAQNDSGDESAVSRESCEEPVAEQERDPEASQSGEGTVTLPEDWYLPEEYVRRCFSEGHTPETALKWLVQQYAEFGLTPEAAVQIVEDILKQKEAS